MTRCAYRALYLFLLVLISSTACQEKDALFELNVIHFNDFHSRFEETSQQSGECKVGDDNCIGGFARLYTAINQLKNKPNSILLNAGDNFQGTLWYTLFKWIVTQYFMNLLPIDAYTIGNHDFDSGIQGLVPFIKALKATTVVCNIDDSLEPDFQGIYQKSTIIERGGKRIGVIGVILSSTDKITNTGKLKFLDEVESITKEAQRLVDEENVFTTILLSHSGYEVDINIAAQIGHKVSLVVGAHTHSFLYNGSAPNTDKVVGPYPTVVNQKDGTTVLVVQASSLTKYLGNLTIYYDEVGKIVTYDGVPVFLRKSIPQDPKIMELLKPWKVVADKYGSRKVGFSNDLLDRQTCYYKECSIGSFYTDAMVDSYKHLAKEGHWNYVGIALTNSGSIWASIPAGNITYSDLITSHPFGDTLSTGEIKGKYIKEALEIGAKQYLSRKSLTDISLLQVSGIRLVVDVSKPEGRRVSSVQMRCNECPIPVFEDLDLEKVYRIALSTYLASGGDSFEVFFNNIQNVKEGNKTTEAFEKYIAKMSPINQKLDGRIMVIGSEEWETRH